MTFPPIINLHQMHNYFTEVYIDGCLMTRDFTSYTPDERLKLEFQDHICITKKFRDLDPRILKRQLSYVRSLNECLKEGKNIKCVNECLDNYEQFIDQVRRSISYFRKKSPGKSGRLEEDLEEIERLHRGNYDLLRARAPKEDYMDYASKIHFWGMAEPSIKLLERKTLNRKKLNERIEEKEERMKRKFSFASAAINSGFKGNTVAIASCDLDIANIIHNYGKYLNQHFPNDGRPLVMVYFPEFERWGPREQVLHFMVDIRGRFILEA